MLLALILVLNDAFGGGCFVRRLGLDEVSSSIRSHFLLGANGRSFAWSPQGNGSRRLDWLGRGAGLILPHGLAGI